MIVRWLGAYGKHATLESSLTWELTQTGREVAAERIGRGDGQGYIPHARIGMWIDSAAVVRHFPGDVYSVRTRRENGEGCIMLKPTRKVHAIAGRHSEVFCLPGYVRAIVVKDHPSRFEKAVRLCLACVAASHKLEIFQLTKEGKRVNVTRLFGRPAK